MPAPPAPPPISACWRPRSAAFCWPARPSRPSAPGTRSRPPSSPAPLLHGPAAAAGGGAARGGDRGLGAAAGGPRLGQQIIGRDQLAVDLDAGERLLVANVVLDLEEL